MIINNRRKQTKNKQINKTSTFEQSASWKANSSLSGPNVSNKLLQPNFHYDIEKS
jgi:hypothetical protein